MIQTNGPPNSGTGVSHTNTSSGTRSPAAKNPIGAGAKTRSITMNQGALHAGQAGRDMGKPTFGAMRTG
jgi:hypothetical protein